MTSVVLTNTGLHSVCPHSECTLLRSETGAVYPTRTLLSQDLCSWLWFCCCGSNENELFTFPSSFCTENHSRNGTAWKTVYLPFQVLLYLDIIVTHCHLEPFHYFFVNGKFCELPSFTVCSSFLKINKYKTRYWALRGRIKREFLAQLHWLHDQSSPHWLYPLLWL